MRRSFVVLAACLSLTACGGTAADRKPGDASAGEQSAASATLTIWADQKRSETLKPFAEAFAEENGVKAEIVVVAQGQQQTFVTASQAGKGPDVLVGAHDWIGNLVQNGLIEPIHMTEDQQSGYVDVARKAVTYDGQVYGVPYAVENLALYRNTDLVPDAPATFDELIATGRELKEKGEVEQIVGYPISQQNGQSGDTYHMYPLYTSGGAHLFGTKPNGDPDPADLGVGTPASIAAFKKIAALGEKGAGALKRSFTSDNSAAMFVQGKTAFLVAGPWRLTEVRTAGVKYDVTPVPAFKDGDPARGFVGVQAFFVASKGRNKALAQEFVTNTLASADVAKALFDAEPRMPALKTALEYAAAKDPDVAKFEAAARDGVPLPAIPQMVAVWQPFNALIHSIVKGDPVEPAVKAAGKAIAEQLGQTE
ncbi:arabinogalactan oligomer/maltooligosaccharide transport system substrate-binding protein [Thermocatellispora tengchongensis]|uniref:Arabinogalactan oligomer/maltooligosaccharide transport system substrate-binding protein n=1 Tax=Thermocatellispora tengchongensis TaxID=1073253 RepID=A0A840NUV5_9ACTN|nr:maltose ABC transporter substrate-binding protein [Thermocatellispora tengchongensis]MBB5130589.1 arabinogalactan oligomer/maltooligosaccharide transport system substrate-binding protein [Thermocatellispora tengchongensis]